MKKIPRRINKIIDKAKRNPVDIRWSEIVTVLEHFGFSIKSSSGGSHHYITHKEKKRYGFTIVKPHGKKKCDPHDIERAIDNIDDLLGEQS